MASRHIPKILSVFLLGSIASAEFQPHNEPLTSQLPPRPNVMLILDDSGSMRTEARVSQMREAATDFINKYRNSAYIGLSTLGFMPLSYADENWGPAEAWRVRPVIERKIRDIGSRPEVTDEHGLVIDKPIENFDDSVSFVSRIVGDGNTPVAYATYEVFKYFRGLPVFDKNLDETSALPDKKWTHPLKYRCQANHVILLTDALPTSDTLYNNIDGIVFTKNSSNILPSVTQAMWNTNLLESAPGSVDAANKAWNYKGASDKIPLYFHGVAFGSKGVVGLDLLKSAAAPSKGIATDATSIKELMSVFAEILNTMIPTKTNTGLAVTSPYPSVNDFIYSSKYDARNWVGRIEARTYDSMQKIIETPVWVTDQTIPLGAPQGNYITLNSNTSVALDASVLGVDDQQINWLKGTDGSLRQRVYALGDIIDSTLYFVGGDYQFINTSQLNNQIKVKFDLYRLYRKENMQNTLVVGSNDGLINFIDAQKGERITSYFPMFLKDSLTAFTAPNYIHTFGMNGNISVFDTIDQGVFTTIGLAAAGAGGKGIAVFKLFSEHTDEIKALYEIKPETGYPDLGYTYSDIDLFTTQNDAIAVFGNGYGSKSGNATLYLANITKKNREMEIVLSNDSNNGASSPFTVIETDTVTGYQKIESAYVGDLKGNLWKVTFTYDEYGALSYNVKLLFSDPQGNPITVKPIIYKKGLTTWVYFGTGKLLETGDINDRKLHHIYAIKDDGGNYPINVDQLLKQELLATELGQGSSSDMIFVKTTKNEITASDRGWYIPLVFQGQNQRGERIIDGPVFTGDKIHFASTVIIRGEPRDPCLPDELKGGLYVFDPTTGRLDAPFFDSNGDGEINSKDVVYSGMYFEHTAPKPFIVNNAKKHIDSDLISPKNGFFVGDKPTDEELNNRRMECVSVDPLTGDIFTVICGNGGKSSIAKPIRIYQHKRF